MFDMMKQGDRTQQKVVQLVLDTPDDVSTLPTDVGAGSTAICISTAEVYMMNNKGEWKSL